MADDDDDLEQVARFPSAKKVKVGGDKDAAPAPSPKAANKRNAEDDAVQSDAAYSRHTETTKIAPAGDEVPRVMQTEIEASETVANPEIEKIEIAAEKISQS